MTEIIRTGFLERRIIASLQPKPKGVWRLLAELDCNARELAAAIKKLLSAGVIKERNGVLFAVQAPHWDKNVWNEFRAQKRLLFDPKGELFKKFKGLVKGFKPKNLSLNQQRAEDIDLFNKLGFMVKRREIAGAKIAVLGDDDLFSLALSLTGLPEGVTVFELDESVLDFIRRVADREGFNIETVKQDLSRPAPKKFCSAFDGFATEQPEARTGLYSFLRFGTQLLKPCGWGYFCLTRVESSLQKWFELEKSLVESGFAVTDIVEGFVAYNGGELDEEQQNLELVKSLPFKVKEERVDFFVECLVRIQSRGKHSALKMLPKGRGESFFVDDETFVQDLPRPKEY